MLSVHLTKIQPGNAATATALETARTIGGVSFDGTANINLPGVNTAGNQDTTGTAALATTVTISANNSTDETIFPVFVDGATGTQGLETDTGFTYNPSTGLLTATGFSGNLTGTLQTAAQPNITSLGTLTTLTVDDITINGSTISDAGDLDFDVGGDIILNADGGDIRFRDGSTEVGTIVMDDGSNTFILKSAQSDADIKFNGVDGGSGITALTLDMSDAGTATFNHDIKLGDNGLAVFGAGDDLKIFHDGSDSFIVDSGTGGLTLASNSLSIKNPALNEILFLAAENGAVELYHDNSKKIETTSAGIDVTGTVTFDGGTTSADLNFGDNDKAVFGADSDYKIYHNGNTGFVENNTGSLFITNSSDDFDIVIQSDDGSGSLTDYFRADGSAGSAILYHYGSQKLATTSSGIDVTGTAVTDGLTVAGNVSVDGGTIKLDGNFPTGTDNIALGNNTALDSAQ